MPSDPIAAVVSDARAQIKTFGFPGRYDRNKIAKTGLKRRWSQKMLEPSPSTVATAIAYVGAFVGLVGGGVALFNSWKAVQWKRAELANSYMKEFNGNQELVFAGRCLDWNGGRLILPESLRPFMPDNAQSIQHDRRLFAKALRPDLLISEMDEDPRIQIYRTSIDPFLSWLSLVASALDRKLFMVADIQDVGYWVAKIQSELVLHGFIIGFGYKENIDKLTEHFRRRKSPYRYWLFPINLPRGHA